MADAIVVHHRFKRAGPLGMPHNVPVLSKPIISYGSGGQRIYRICPTCHVHHPCKTVHLWLDDKGDCGIAPGVLEDLKLAGMPDLTIVGHDSAPPTIELSMNRAIVDRNNRAIRPLTPMKVRAA